MIYLNNNIKSLTTNWNIFIFIMIFSLFAISKSRELQIATCLNTQNGNIEDMYEL